MPNAAAEDGAQVMSDELLVAEVRSLRLRERVPDTHSPERLLLSGAGSGPVAARGEAVGVVHDAVELLAWTGVVLVERHLVVERHAVRVAFERGKVHRVAAAGQEP